MPVVTCIEDLRQMAKKRVARAVFEYVDGGAYTEATLRANSAELEAIALRQRVAIDVDNRSTRTPWPATRWRCRWRSRQWA